MERPSTPIQSSQRVEYDTPKRARFFQAYDSPGVTISQACRFTDIKFSTGQYWVAQRKKLGSLALRRTRKTLDTLSQPYTVSKVRLQGLLSQSYLSHHLDYDSIVKKKELNLIGRLNLYSKILLIDLVLSGLRSLGRLELAIRIS
jgi:transposase-like protein